MSDEHPDRLQADPKLEREWKFRANFKLEPELPPGTWTVEGEVQNDEITRANLLAAVNKHAPAKPTVMVSPPAHMTIFPIIGFVPPFKPSG